MARFVYRLQKIYELRERRVKEQEQKLIEARRAVQEKQSEIDAKKQEMKLVKENMLQASYLLMGDHDRYLFKSNQDLEQLNRELEQRKQRQREEAELLQQYQADLEALEKHKEKAKEEWQNEQKQKEIKQLDEVATQRFFRQGQINEEEALEDAENNWD